MNFINNLIPESLIEAFGWMIVHSLWQGILVALLLSAALLILNKRSARIRYIVAVGALLLFSAMSIRTFIDHYDISVRTQTTTNLQEKIAGKESIPNNTINNDSITESTLFNELSFYFVEHFPLIVSIYLMGVLFLTLKLSGGYLYSQRVKHYRTSAPDLKFKKMVDDFSSKLKIKQKVELVESALVKVPVTLGYFKPVILFPLGLLNGMSYEQVEAIIAHELAHIKRADYLINIIQSFVEVIFFYHPVVWWISSIIKEERENVCDDLALELSDHPSELAKALVFIGHFELQQPTLAMSAIGNKNTLKRRVKRMMGENKHKSIKNRVYSVSLLLLIIISFSAIACSTAKGESYYQEKNTNLVYKEDAGGDKRFINTDYQTDDLRSYVFYKRFHGEKIKWEATVDGSKLITLYKDGDLVASDEFSQYEDMILDEVDDIDWEMRELQEDLADLKEELKDLKINLGEDFQEDMKELAEELRTEFNSKEFKQEMADLQREIRDMDFDFDFDFDWNSDEFRKEMAELKHELSNIKVNVDLSGLDEEMRQLKAELKDLDIDMSGLKREMKVLKSFLHELKNEMISDGVIEDDDSLFELEFENDGMYVNDKKVPHDLYLKYREIYKKYYDEYPDEDSFHINNH